MAGAHVGGRQKPITATLIRDIVDGINAKFRGTEIKHYRGG